VNGLGNPTREAAARTDGAHQTQTATTWTTTVTNQTPFTPPTQGNRARAFVQEAAATTGTVTYTWSALKPGTYLIETGTYPRPGADGLVRRAGGYGSVDGGCCGHGLSGSRRPPRRPHGGTSV